MFLSSEFGHHPELLCPKLIVFSCFLCVTIFRYVFFGVVCLKFLDRDLGVLPFFSNYSRSVVAVLLRPFSKDSGVRVVIAEYHSFFSFEFPDCPLSAHLDVSCPCSGRVVSG